ncbi:serine protease Do [Allopseudospirillum japonicum]|uniref:Probable periplasmic serine endoprotease DegP-like n=1 Tax=Allopseudospirillum japonicum TaxID=64971 RepID=A0A1H6SJQ3_9GAMM|nr:DegQ family serine endoprotease [Allopseudospirillum japonicum]SEI63682.1 serine protease Do [Allopseudospirillum japonicum]
MQLAISARRYALFGVLVLAGLMSLVPEVQARSLPDFTELVEEASPAVVNISTTRVVNQRSGLQGFMNPEELPQLFRHFFGDQLPFNLPEGKAVPRQSLGSGFIISEDGYILTNNHVVEEADEIIVRLSDRRELTAKLIGSDPKTDIALLKIEARDLPVVELGKVSRLKVGEWVLAIGSPFGFDHTVTAGIISAMGRSLPNETYVPFIQTDVAINPGNSGGPLFNLKGEVIGINSQIYTRSGGFMGLSFAIPIDVAMNVVEQLKEDGRVVRGWLGVQIQEVDRDLAKSFGLDRPMGALIASVDEQGPAARSGIQSGDIVLEFDGHEISRAGDLPPAVGNLRPGNQAYAKVWREGRLMTLTVEVGARPEENKLATSQSAQNAPLGLIVKTLEEGTHQPRYGVQVERVLEGEAARAGIQVGDVITRLGYTRIRSVQDWQALVGNLASGEVVHLHVVREGRSHFVAIKVD